MDVLVELAKILLPSVIVLYAMYLTMKSILEKDLEKQLEPRGWLDTGR